MPGLVSEFSRHLIPHVTKRDVNLLGLLLLDVPPCCLHDLIQAALLTFQNESRSKARQALVVDADLSTGPTLQVAAANKNLAITWLNFAPLHPADGLALGFPEQLCNTWQHLGSVAEPTLRRQFLFPQLFELPILG